MNFLNLILSIFITGTKGLKCVNIVKKMQESVYVSLKKYCLKTYPKEPYRYAKLLLQLPMWRSISLDCNEHSFFQLILGSTFQSIIHLFL